MAELAIRMVASLAIVVGLLLVIARISSKRFQGRAGNAVTVLHRQALSRSSSVAVVSVGNRVLVLGTTEQHVQILTELDPTDLETTDPAGAADLAGTVEVGPAEIIAHDAAPDFASTLRASLAASSAAPVTAPAAAPATVENTAVESSDVGSTAGGGRRRATGTEARPVAGARRAGTHAATGAEPTQAPTAPRHAAPRHAATPTATTTASPAPLADPLTDPLPVTQPAPQAAALAAPQAGARKAVSHKAAPARAGARRATPAVEQDGPLAGSVLSPQTWRQAFHAVSRRAS